MNKSLEQVLEFQQVFDQGVGNINELEPLATRQLRIRLLFEELEELSQASDCTTTFFQLCSAHADSIYNCRRDADNVNQIEELDALCDIQYVLNGKIITAGMHHIFDRNFDLVHQNNMSKAHLTHNHVLDTVTRKGFNLDSCSVVPKKNVFLLLDSAGKLTKPWNHTKVALTLT